MPSADVGVACAPFASASLGADVSFAVSSASFGADDCLLGRPALVDDDDDDDDGALN